MMELVVTRNVLASILSNPSPESINSSSDLHVKVTDNGWYIAHWDDVENSQLITLVCEDLNVAFLPPELRSHGQDAISRIITFAGYAKAINPLRLPIEWSAYRVNSLVAFFALSQETGSRDRWVAFTEQTAESDITMYEIYNGDLNEYHPSFEVSNISVRRRLWQDAFDNVRSARKRAQDNLLVPEDTELVRHYWGDVDARSFEDWTRKLSCDQNAFFESPITAPTRLLGPAGSGKSTLLCLKAIQTFIEAPQSEKPRIAIITHSWKIAYQLSAFINTYAPRCAENIVVLPLLALLESIYPLQGTAYAGYSLISDDSHSAKLGTLTLVEMAVVDFKETDWIGFEDSCSEQLRARMNSTSLEDQKLLHWSLLNEFGTVIGGSAIFPSLEGIHKYESIKRREWMMELENKDDRSVVYRIYEIFFKLLEDSSYVTNDQYVADVNSYFNTFSWNKLRLKEGFDYIFIDEYHLFNSLEKVSIVNLTRDVSSYAKIVMAVDPRQSPISLLGANDSTGSGSAYASVSELEAGGERTLTLDVAHRFSPNIFNFITHLYMSYSSLDLDSAILPSQSSIDADCDRSGCSLQYFQDRQAFAELIAAQINAIPSGETVALVMIDEKQWLSFDEDVPDVNKLLRGRNISKIRNAEDAGTLIYQRKTVAYSLAEYVHGLQFDTVLISGLPSSSDRIAQLRLPALLYMASSRAKKNIHFFVQTDADLPNSLSNAISKGLIQCKQSGM